MADAIEPQIKKIMRNSTSITKSESLKLEKAVIKPGTVRIANILSYMKSKESL